jgi:hypothetical protein
MSQKGVGTPLTLTEIQDVQARGIQKYVLMF